MAGCTLLYYDQCSYSLKTQIVASHVNQRYQSGVSRNTIGDCLAMSAQRLELGLCLLGRLTITPGLKIPMLPVAAWRKYRDRGSEIFNLFLNFSCISSNVIFFKRYYATTHRNKLQH